MSNEEGAGMREQGGGHTLHLIVHVPLPSPPSSLLPL